jgi:hypothetical protein
MWRSEHFLRHLGTFRSSASSLSDIDAGSVVFTPEHGLSVLQPFSMYNLSQEKLVESKTPQLAVRVAESTVPNAGEGLFARVDIPKGYPIFMDAVYAANAAEYGPKFPAEHSAAWWLVKKWLQTGPPSFHEKLVKNNNLTKSNWTPLDRKLFDVFSKLYDQQIVESVFGKCVSNFAYTEGSPAILSYLYSKMNHSTRANAITMYTQIPAGTTLKLAADGLVSMHAGNGSVQEFQVAFALENIKAGQEIFIDYGPEHSQLIE